MKVLEKELARISFSNTTEREGFLKDVKVLFISPKMKVLVHPKTIRSIYLLYLSLSANVSVFSKILKGNDTSSLLFNFFHDTFGDDLSFPQSIISIDLFIKLCDSKIEKNDLRKLLKSRVLDSYTSDKIKIIESLYLQNMVILIEFYHKYGDEFSKQEGVLVLEMLSLFKNEIDEKTSDDLYYFLKNIVPFFTSRFAHRMNQEALFKNPEKFVNWFLVWKNHYYQLEENETGTYYETDFTTIIKYIPEYLWWNNGVFYHGKNKHYQFGSEGFFFLATGGSIRKSLDNRPYTRRMAREFVQLKYDLDLGEKHDLYLYLFGKSLGGGEKLSRSLRQYMRHPKHEITIQKEFDKWNPVIQKFSSNEFEVLCEEAIQTLMGYIYHCLRDKKDYSVQGKSIVDIMHESDNYYRRILHREEVRQQRALEKAKLIGEDPKVKSWKSSIRIKPFIKVHIPQKRSANQSFNIVQLLNEQQLQEEGRALNHCVGGYADACMKTPTTIWSLRHFDKGGWRSKVTIEVKGKIIVQIRGKYNATAKEAEREIIDKWASREALIFNNSRM